jgi:hypothetical protein
MAKVRFKETRVDSFFVTSFMIESIKKPLLEKAR